MVLLITFSGCTKFTPGALQDLLNNKPEAWRTEAKPPAEFYLAPGDKETLNSLSQDGSEESQAKKPGILPEIDPAELAAMNEVVSSIPSTNSQSDENRSGDGISKSSTPARSAVVQELVPAAGVIGQPLRPLTFDHESRKRIVDEVQSLREDNVIKLTAEPSLRPLIESQPQIATEQEQPAASPVASQLPPEPALPPLEIVDARYVPNPTSPVELPVFDPMTDEVELLSQVENATAAAKPALDENTVNEFEPATPEPPKNQVVESVANQNEFAAQLQPVKRIDSHSAECDPAFDLGASLSARSLQGSVVGAAASLPAPPTSEPAEPVAIEQSLRLVNANFCTSVSGYGQFDAFEANRFGPHQHLLVYCEIENFHSVKEDETDGSEKFVTRLRGSYTILDADGKQVDGYEFPVVDDIARNQRRDFYVHLPVQLGDLPAGNYSIQLNIDDLNGNTSANLAIPLEFEVIQ